MTPKSTGPVEDPLPTPALDRLRLTDAERAILATQGFVASEIRRGRCRYFKLRFRLDGRQRVVYLGADAAFAAQVAAELQQLQSPRDQLRHLDRLTTLARRTLRQIKQDLQRSLSSAGYRFHGFAIRRRRKPTSPPLSAHVPIASRALQPQGEPNDDP